MMYSKRWLLAAAILTLGGSLNGMNRLVRLPQVGRPSLSHQLTNRDYYGYHIHKLDSIPIKLNDVSDGQAVIPNSFLKEGKRGDIWLAENLDPERIGMFIELHGGSKHQNPFLQGLIDRAKGFQEECNQLALAGLSTREESNKLFKEKVPSVVAAFFGEHKELIEVGLDGPYEIQLDGHVDVDGRRKMFWGFLTRDPEYFIARLEADIKRLQGVASVEIFPEEVKKRALAEIKQKEEQVKRLRAKYAPKS